MQELNLSNHDKGDISYEKISFPDGQVLINLLGKYLKGMNFVKDDVKIVSRMTWEDLQSIICANKALKSVGFKNVHLYVPYFLGARSDRKFKSGGINYLKDVICPIINSQGFASVTVLDPHSNCLEMGLNNYDPISSLPLIGRFLRDTKLDRPVWLIPDKGAAEKARDLIKSSEFKGSVVQCDKIRDIITGDIIETKVPLDKFDGRDAFIVDDICDGGRTFIEIAKICKAHGCGKLYLVVSHGIFSKGFMELGSYFESIYTTNSVHEWPEDNHSIKTLKVL